MQRNDKLLSRGSKRLCAVLLAATLAGALAGCAGTPAREYFDDGAITSKIKAEYATDHDVSALHIHVTTNMGHVRLTGTATSEAERVRAEQIARGVKGVKSVTDEIVLRKD